MTTGNVRPASMERITTPALAQKFIEEQIRELRAQIGDKKVLLALSGGVDSSVVAALLIKAVGKQLVSVHVNHGLLRKPIGSSTSWQASPILSRSVRSLVLSSFVSSRKKPVSRKASVSWLREPFIPTSLSLVL